MANESESFVRWQSVVRDQLSAATNLALGLATGLLAFQSMLLLDNKLLAPWSRGFGIAAIPILGLSIALAAWCALNRLSDFRLTARVARGRHESEAGLAELREKSYELGKTTWVLFRVQLWLFALGAVAAAVSVLVQVAS